MSDPKILSKAKEKFRTGWEYSLEEKAQYKDTDNDNKKEIDCSHLVNSSVNAAGYNIPYLSTKELFDKTGKITIKFSQYFIKVETTNVGPGDLVAFEGHVAILETYDSTSRNGTCFGSQSSTGPATTSFGPDSYYWGTERPGRSGKTFFFFFRPINATRDNGNTGSNEAEQSKKSNPAPYSDMPASSGLKIQYCLPLTTSKQPEKITASALNQFYKKIEVDKKGGFYPVGANTVWHGGVHINESKGAPVFAFADGIVIAARMPSSGEPGLPYGTRNFVLIKHTFDNKFYYSLYFHLDYPTSEQLDQLSWLKKPQSVLVKAERNLRREKTLDTNSAIKLIKGTVANPVKMTIDSFDGSWYEVKSLDGNDTGFLAKANTIVEADYRTDQNILSKLKEAQIVKFQNPVRAGDLIGYVGVYGSNKFPIIANYSVPQIHWEIFATDNIFETDTTSVEDKDTDFTCDSSKILQMINSSKPDAWELEHKEVNLTRDEIASFFNKQTNRTKNIRTFACKFISEWGISDWSNAIKKMHGRDPDPKLITKLNKYCFWDEAKSVGVDMPGSKFVWHYNPVFVVEVLTNIRVTQTRSEEETTSAQEQTHEPIVDNQLFYIKRGDENVLVESPSDFIETDYSHVEDNKKIRAKSVFFSENKQPKNLGIITKYGTTKGISFGGEPNLYEILMKNKSQWDITISDRHRNIWSSIYRNEGGLNAINSYDRAFLSIGPIQKIIGTEDGAGELPGTCYYIKNQNSTLYEKVLGKYGLEPEIVQEGDIPIAYFKLDGILIKSPAQKDVFRRFIWAYRFLKAFEDKTFAILFLESCFKRILVVEKVKKKNEEKVVAFSDVYKTELAHALVLDAHINLPSLVVGSLPIWLKAINNTPRVLKKINDDKLIDITIDEELELIKLIIEYRNTSRMSDPIARAAFIVMCVKEIQDNDSLIKKLGYSNRDELLLNAGLNKTNFNYFLNFLGVERQ